LDGYTDSVVQTAFLSRGDAFLVEAGQASNQGNHGDSGLSPVTATIAVAAAAVSFVVLSVFCYGCLQRDGRHHPEPSVRHKGRALKSSNRTVVSGSLGGRSRRHFVRLEDLSASSISHVTPSLTPMSHGYDCDFEEPDVQGYEYGCNPAIAWSVSDITSDSVSVRSSVSRSPSTLERIEEEEEDREKESDLESLAKAEGNATGTSQVREKVEDYDCKSLKRSEMMDVSDVEACFMIAPSLGESPIGAQCGSRRESFDCVVKEDTQLKRKDDTDVPCAGCKGSAPETSYSDFSCSSMLVLYDLEDHVLVTSAAMSDTSDGNVRNLELSCSKSNDTIEFLDSEAQVHGNVGEVSGTERETKLQISDSNIQDESHDFCDNDEDDSDENLTKLAEDKDYIDESVSLNSLNKLTESLTTSELSGVEFPYRSEERNSNVDDSIDEWVSELLEHYPREE
jgi:hypothetical protein